MAQMVMKESGLLPMSGALQQLARRMKTVEDNLSLSLGRNPTLAEIAAHVSLPSNGNGAIKCTLHFILDQVVSPV